MKKLKNFHLPGLSKNTSVIVLTIILLIIIGSVAIFIIKSRQTNSQVKMTDNEQQKLIDQVGKLILLPQGEAPTIATVSDVTKLNNQQFFKNAVNGDRVLIYQAAKKAILYRPSENRIIEVAPVNIGSSATQSAQLNQTDIIPTPDQTRIVLLNGTNVTGLTKSYETDLTAKLPDAEILDRDNAAKRDYEETILVKSDAVSESVAQDIITKLEIKISDLPEGETFPKDTDYLIIIGSDYADKQGE